MHITWHFYYLLMIYLNDTPGPYNSLYLALKFCYFQNNFTNRNIKHFQSFENMPNAKRQIWSLHLQLYPDLKIIFWLTQEFSVYYQNTSVLRHELHAFFSHCKCLQSSLPNLIYEVCKHGEVCWCYRTDLHIFFFLLKCSFTLSVSVIQAPLWQGIEGKKMAVPE